MSTLTNKRISDTYKGLLKTADESTLTATPIAITDGDGNSSGVLLDNSGNLKVNNTVEFGSLKDAAEDITIEKFVDEADGIENNDNDTSLPTSAAVKNYVDTQITAEDLDFSGNTGTGDVDLDSEIFEITGSNGITTTALDNTLDIDGSALETAINTNTANIATNVTDIATNASDISTNAGNIATNATNIASNDIDIAANAAAISTNQTNIGVNATGVSNNAANISTNTANITTNTANIASNDTDIASLQTSVSTNTSNIATNASNISGNTTNIATNAGNITTNATNISSNSTAIATNATAISNNATNIASNDTDIAANASNISTNTSNISTNTTDIATNASGISTNTADIATNTTDIATNTSSISTNATGISNNATAIANNTTAIQQNTSDIGNKVSKSGDSMSNTLFINRNGSSQLNINNGQAVFGTHYTSNDVWLYAGQNRSILLGGGIGGLQNDVKVQNGYIYSKNGIRIGADNASRELDDYEVGTFNPSIFSVDTGTPTVFKYGRYTKIGNLVTVTVLLRVINASATTYSPRSITNLPYTTENLDETTVYSGIGTAATGTFSSMFCYAFKSASTLYIRERNTSGTVDFVTFPASATHEICFQITYPVQ